VARHDGDEPGAVVVENRKGHMRLGPAQFPDSGPSLKLSVV